MGSLINKVLGIITIVTTAISTVFILLFKSETDKKKDLEKKNEELRKDTEEKEKIIDFHKEVEKDTVKGKEENEKKLSDALNGNNLDSFDKLNDILSN